MRYAAVILLLPAALVSAAAQDIRGLERCTAEKAMERRTGCLQGNIEFLQQALVRQRREADAKVDALTREVSAQKAEIAALQATLARLQQELSDLKKSGKPGK